jgi:hypothetical protein
MMLIVADVEGVGIRKNRDMVEIDLHLVMPNCSLEQWAHLKAKLAETLAKGNTLAISAQVPDEEDMGDDAP